MSRTKRVTPLQRWRVEYAVIVGQIRATRKVTRGRKSAFSTKRLELEGHSPAQIERIVRRARKTYGVAQAQSRETFLSAEARRHMERRSEAAEASRQLWLENRDKWAARVAGEEEDALVAEAEPMAMAVG